MKLKLCSLGVVKKGDWCFKASSLDDRILVVGFNYKTVAGFMKMFYNEEVAYYFMENFYDKNCKTHYG